MTTGVRSRAESLDWQWENSEKPIPFALACESGHFQAALRHLDPGVDAGVEWNSQTPVHAATLSMLKCDTSSRTKGPRTEDEREERIGRPPRLGVDVNEVGALWRTALHIASGQQALARTLQSFLDTGAHANALDELEQTPFHVAIEYFSSLRSEYQPERRQRPEGESLLGPFKAPVSEVSQ